MEFIPAANARRMSNSLRPMESWEEEMRACITALMMADELHLLPCWQNSKGAVLEHGTAQRIGITIVYPS
jgi:hypothetical protein